MSAPARGSSRRRTDTRNSLRPDTLNKASRRIPAAADGWQPVQRVWVLVRTVRSRAAANRMGWWSSAWPIRGSAPRVRPSTNSASAEAAEEQNQNLDHHRGGCAGGDSGGRRRHRGNQRQAQRGSSGWPEPRRQTSRAAHRRTRRGLLTQCRRTYKPWPPVMQPPRCPTPQIQLLPGPC